MPSKSKVEKNVRRLKGKVYGILFMFCMILVVIFMFNSSVFLVSRVAINGNKVLSKKEILALSEIDVSHNIFRIKLSDIENKVVLSPRIKSVKVARVLPNKLVLNIVERHELLAIKYIGIHFIVDSDGYIINTQKDNSGYYQVEGLEVTAYKDGTKIETIDDGLLNGIIKLCQFIEISGLEFKPNFKIDGEEIFMYMNPDFVVKFGDGEEVEDRFNKFYAIYEDLKRRSINSGVININHSGYPSYVPYDD